MCIYTKYYITIQPAARPAPRDSARVNNARRAARPQGRLAPLSKGRLAPLSLWIFCFSPGTLVNTVGFP